MLGRQIVLTSVNMKRFWAFLIVIALLPIAAGAQDDPFLLGEEESRDRASLATRGVDRPEDAANFLVVLEQRAQQDARRCGHEGEHGDHGG